MGFKKDHTINNNRIPWNKGKKGLLSGKDSPHWKGNNIAYSTIHYWMIRTYGNPAQCEKCGIEGKYNGSRWNIQWANKSQTYKRSRNDFMALCIPCHRKYDPPKKKGSDAPDFTSVQVSCLSCKKSFYVQPHRFKSGRGKYCSRKCSNLHTLF